MLRTHLHLFDTNINLPQNIPSLGGQATHNWGQQLKNYVVLRIPTKSLKIPILTTVHITSIQLLFIFLQFLLYFFQLQRQFGHNAV